MAHTSVTLGGVKLGPPEVKLGQQGQTRRCLAAGEARRGGAVWVLHSNDQMDDGDLLRVAGSKTRRVVAVGGAGVVGNVAGNDLGGRRSSGEVETEATGHGEACGVELWAPASVVSALVTKVWPVGGRSHVGDELGGGGCLGVRGAMHTMHEELMEGGR